MLSVASHEPLAVEINLQFVGLGSVSREASPRLASPPLGHASRALVGGWEGEWGESPYKPGVLSLQISRARLSSKVAILHTPAQPLTLTEVGAEVTGRDRRLDNEPGGSKVRSNLNKRRRKGKGKEP